MPNTPLLLANPHVTSVAKPKPKVGKAGQGQHRYMTIKLKEVFISQ
jgi:hypothetical protein